jgi:hypothetical protein
MRNHPMIRLTAHSRVVAAIPFSNKSARVRRRLSCSFENIQYVNCTFTVFKVLGILPLLLSLIVVTLNALCKSAAQRVQRTVVRPK